jgi:hypothetical protein
LLGLLISGFGIESLMADVIIADFLLFYRLSQHCLPQGTVRQQQVVF